MQQLKASDIGLLYTEQGSGVPVVFVHGAWTDLRYWEPQREAIAANYRFVAYNLRYHGSATWPDAGERFSIATHSADLLAFIRNLNAGPVHLVGLSAGGRLVTLVALGQADLVSSLTLLEPPIDELLADMPAAQPVRDEWIKAFEPIRAAAFGGDTARAARLFFDLANNQGTGAFDRQPETFRQMVLDNARTIPLQLLALRDRPAMSCLALNGLKERTLVVGGDESPRYLSLINERLVQCIPESRLVVVPRAAHLMSYQNPSAFNSALLDFLADAASR